MHFYYEGQAFRSSQHVKPHFYPTEINLKINFGNKFQSKKKFNKNFVPHCDLELDRTHVFAAEDR